MLVILEEPISEKSINEIINCQNITDMGMTSLDMVMFIVELENKYDCKIDITGLCTKDNIFHGVDSDEYTNSWITEINKQGRRFLQS